MSLELHQAFPNGTVVRTGSIVLNLLAGRKIEFKTFSGGDIDKFYEAEVPAGKKWELSVSIRIVET